MKWTPEEIILLRQLWAKEWKTERIGKKLGRSKCSVIGQAHRLQLPIHPRHVHKTTRKHVPKREPAQEATIGKTKLKAIEHGQQGEYTFEQIAGNAMCRWPMANNTWCGRSTLHVYCLDHAQLAHRPTPGKKHFKEA